MTGAGRPARARRGADGDRAQVVVVGGGVVGLSATTYLARAGAHVTLCERGDLYAGASSKNLGVLSDIDVPAGVARALFRRGRELFFGLPEELEADIGLQHRGAVTYGRIDDGDEEFFKAFHAENAGEINIELLDRDQLHELVPELAPDLDTGLLSRDEAKFENHLVCQAYANAAQRLGARIVRRSQVVAIETVGGAVKGVRTGDGSMIPADVVVLAAGPGTETLARTAGVEVPLVMVRGQVGLTEPTTPLLGPVIYSKDHIHPDGSLIEAFVAAQTADGRIIFGGPVESGTEREAPTVNGLAVMARNLRDAVPATHDLAVDRIWAGLAVFAADGLPLVGWVPDCDGLLLAVGSLNTSGPAVGEMVAALVAGEHPEFEAELSPTRDTTAGESQNVWVEE